MAVPVGLQIGRDCREGRAKNRCADDRCDDERVTWQKPEMQRNERRPKPGNIGLAFNADVFNLFNSQKPTYIYEYQNANQFGRVRGYTTPRYVRLGVTYDF